MSSLLDSVILYVVSLGDDPSSFFFSRPCGEIAAGLFLCGPAWSHRLQRKLPMSLCSDFYMKECRANIHHELHGSKKSSKSVSTLPRFLHRWTADNMQPLTGGDAGRIRRGVQWLLILVRSNFKKISKRGFQKARFWTLGDGSRAENFLEVVSLCPIFPM